MCSFENTNQWLSMVKVNKDGKFSGWFGVPFPENYNILYLGDLMQLWTNNIWKSTFQHAILTPQDDQKHQFQSTALIVNINGDAEVLPIETCIN